MITAMQFLRPGVGLVLPAGVIDLIRLDCPPGPRGSLRQHREHLAARAEAERGRAERLDWRAHVPAADGEADSPAPEAELPLSDVDGLLDEQAVIDARVQRLRAEDAEVRAAMRARATSGATWPSAAEFASWSDERLSRDWDLAHLDEADWPDDDPFADPDGEEEVGEMHPLQGLMFEVQQMQRELRRAESDRVAMALRAWRAAEEFVTGTPSAMLNGPFHRSVMMQLAHDLQVAERTAMSLVHVADDLDRRLPACWDRFLGAEVPWRAMQILHAELDGLDEEFWPAFDEQAAAALVRTPVPRLKPKLREIRERIQVRTAVDRHKAALARMHVGIEPAADGMAWLTALLPAAEAVFIDRRLDLAARAAAAAEGETRSIGQLRAHILLDVVDEGLFRGAGEHGDGLAVPERRGVQCKVGLLIPAMTAIGRRDEPAVLEDYGPIDIETAKRLAGGATSWIKVLTDPITGAVIDIGREKYRPTSDMRALLGLLDRGGRGPGCTRPPSQTEADHVVAYRQGLARGRTALDNLVLLARAHHRVKTSGLWDIQLMALRALAWTSFMGTRIITEVEPLPPTPVPAEFLAPPRESPAASPPLDWSDPDQPDDLDCPF